MHRALLRTATRRSPGRPACRGQDLAVLGAGPEQVPAQRDRARVQRRDDRRPAADGLKSPIATTDLWGGRSAVLAARLDRRRPDRRPQLRQQRGDGDESPLSGQLPDLYRHGPCPWQAAVDHGMERPVSRDRPIHRALCTWRASPRSRAGTLRCSITIRRWSSSVRGPRREARINKWSTYYDPALTGVMPAAAFAFRRGHVSPAGRPTASGRPGAALRDDAHARARHGHHPDARRAEQADDRHARGQGASLAEAGEASRTSPSSPTRITTTFPPEQPRSRSDTGELARNWALVSRRSTRPGPRPSAAGSAARPWPQGRELPVPDQEGRGRAFEHRRPAALVVPVHPGHGRRTGSSQPSARTSPVPSEPVTGTITLRSQACRSGIAGPWS